jgi:hypothetical protein
MFPYPSLGSIVGENIAIMLAFASLATAQIFAIQLLRIYQ